MDRRWSREREDESPRERYSPREVRDWNTHSRSDSGKKRRQSYSEASSASPTSGHRAEQKSDAVRKRGRSGVLEGTGDSISKLQQDLVESKRAENEARKQLLELQSKVHDEMEIAQRETANQANELRDMQQQLELLRKENDMLKKVALGKKTTWKKEEDGEKCNRCDAVAFDRCWETGVPLCVDHYQPVPFKPENVRLVMQLAGVPTSFVQPNRSIVAPPNDYATIATVSTDNAPMHGILPTTSTRNSFITLGPTGLLRWDVSGRSRDHAPFSTQPVVDKIKFKASPDLNKLILAGGSTLEVMDLSSSQHCYTLRSSSESPWPAWSCNARAPGVTRFANGTCLCLKMPLCFVGDESGCIHAWDLHTQQHMRIFFAHTKRVTAIDIANDRVSLISGSLDGMVRVHNLNTGNEFHINIQTAVTALAASPVDPFVAVGCIDGTVRLIDLAACSLVGGWQVENCHSECTTLEFAASGDWFVSGGKTRNQNFDNICVWSTHDQKKHLEIQEPNQKGNAGITDCAISQECLYVASGCGSAYIYLMKHQS